MGANVDREQFGSEDHARFAAQLELDLAALKTALAIPGFGAGSTTLGAELEMSLVDGAGLALPLNAEVIAQRPHPQLALELDRFNLEYNLSAVDGAGRPFLAFEREMHTAITSLRDAAAELGGDIALCGILPTLRATDLQPSIITDVARYHALSNALRAQRGAPFQIDIQGEESLQHSCDDVTMEGAATSFQVHIRVEPEQFAALYNAAQLAIAPVLALSTNSPIFLGKRLWRETRVALFKQAVDSRTDAQQGRVLPRVIFGRGWVQQGVAELFEAAVRDFPALLPAVAGEDPAAALAQGGAPQLSALRLHAGTVWPWNRPVYDPARGGHLRVELRALPAGPTAIDMAASAALLVGLSLGLQPRMAQLQQALPFEVAQANFFSAAQFGIDAQLLWPGPGDGPPQRHTLATLMPQLLELAHAGLERLGVEADERSRLLGVVRARAQAHTTGACWQLRMLDRLSTLGSREQALSAMFACYLRESHGGKPVHEWSEAL